MHCFENAFNSADIKFNSGGKDCIKKGEFPSSPSLLTQKAILECIIMQSWGLMQVLGRSKSFKEKK